jgi:hypothetical protein
MAYLILPRQSPPGGWRYFQPETRLWFDGDDQGVYDLAERIAAHRAYKGLPRATQEEAMHDIHAQLCDRLGPEYCRAEPTEDWRPLKRDYSLGISASQVMGFSKALIEAVRGGDAFTSEEEARRRAEICLSCPLNTKPSGCTTCSVIESVTAGLIQGSRRYPDLHVCAACGCGLKLKVNVSADIIRKADEGRDINYPPNCWVPGVVSASP